jgi:N-methylhydantoinase A
LFSDIEHHDVRSCRLSGPTLNPGALRTIRAELESAMLARFAAEGYIPERVLLQYSVDLRYQGQFSEIRVPLAETLDEATVEKLLADYLKEHQALYGHVGEHGTAIEAVNVRLVGRIASRAERSVLRPAENSRQSSTSREAYFGREYGLTPTPVIGRHELGERVAGPLLIDEYDSTIVVPPRMMARRDEQFNIVLEWADD